MTTRRLRTLLVALLVGATVPAASARQSPNGVEATRALRGAIDVHVHSYPDSRPRSVDALEAAELVKTRGMRAIVLKNHEEPTGGLAQVVRRHVPGIEVFGGISLNFPVGGINPAAVEYMTRTAGGYGRIVWMPTFDAENQVRVAKQNRPSVAVARNGDLLPDVKAVIGLIAKHGLVLATGHSSPEETLLLLREARRQGADRLLVTHAIHTPVFMSIRQMKEAASLGALIELAIERPPSDKVGGARTEADYANRLDVVVDVIRQVGPAFLVLSSDLGQEGNAVPPDGFGAFLAALRGKGVTQQDIDRMVKQNPARLLGLS